MSSSSRRRRACLLREAVAIQNKATSVRPRSSLPVILPVIVAFIVAVIVAVIVALVSGTSCKIGTSCTYPLLAHTLLPHLLPHTLAT